MHKYIDDTIKRLEAIIRGFEGKYGDKVEMMLVLDIRRAIEALNTIIDKYK